MTASPDESQTPTIVLLHAFPLDHRMWDAQAAALSAQGWRVQAWDLPGFGGTALPESAPSLAIVGQQVATRIRSMNAGPVVLGGMSLGGYVAMAVAGQSPELLAGLLLCDTKASADAPSARASRLAMADAVTDSPASCAEILRTHVLPNLVGPTTMSERPAVVQRLQSWIDEVAPSTVAWYQRAMADRPDSHDILRGLGAPCLVLWGTEDVLSPGPEQASMVAVLRGPTSVAIEGSGHLSALECPGEVSRALSSFLLANVGRGRLGD